MADQISSAYGRFFAVSEASYNVDAVAAAITANDNLRLQSLTSPLVFTPNLDELRATFIRGGSSTKARTATRRNLGVSAEGLFRGGVNPGNAAGEAPAWAAFLKAAGFGETITAGVSAVYRLVSHGSASMSAWSYLRHVDNAQWRLIPGTGIRGNMTISGEAGQLITWSFEGESANFPFTSDTADYAAWSEKLGFFNATTGQIALGKDGGSVSYTGTLQQDATEQMVLRNATIEIDEEEVCVTSFELQTNWQVAAVACASGEETIDEVYLVREAPPTLSLVLADSSPDAFHAVSKAAIGAAEMEIELSIVGADNTITIAAPKAQPSMPEAGDADGLVQWTCNFELNGDYGASNLGDNELTITFAETP
jgi:hypothetical protein